MEHLQVPYLVTGSVAEMVYGEPRLSNGIDIVAGLKSTDIPAFVRAFPPEEFYVSEDAARDAVFRRGQFNVIDSRSGSKVDMIIQKDTAFERSRFARARTIWSAKRFGAKFAAPEDVILKKLEYYREGGSEKHLRDVASMLRISATLSNGPPHWD